MGNLSVNVRMFEDVGWIQLTQDSLCMIVVAVTLAVAVVVLVVVAAAAAVAVPYSTLLKAKSGSKSNHLRYRTMNLSSNLIFRFFSPVKQ
jgi:hypothetical protein